jgi:hypothetical protein
MKKYIISLALLLIPILSGFASVSLIMPHRSGASGTQITIPVKVKDFSNIISAQGSIQWNPAIVSFVSVQNYGLPSMSAGNFGTTQTSSGKLTFSWFDNTLAGISVSDSSTIFSITFTITGSAAQVSNLNFISTPTPVEIVNNAYVTQTTLTVNGSITVSGGAPVYDLNLYADTITGNAGSQVAVSVRATDFTNINSCQGTLQFNASVASYAGISYFGLPGMSIGNFGTSQTASGKLMFSWSDATLAGQNVADNAALFTILFNLTGTAGSQTPVSFISSPTPLEVTDSLFHTLNTSTSAGYIHIRPSISTSSLRYYCDTVSAPAGSTVTVSMHAIDFENIISMQGTLQFNPSIATFDTIDYYGLPSMNASTFGLSQIASGKIMFSWNDPTLAGVSVGDTSVLFKMKFHLTGTPGTFTLLDFVNSPTPMESVDNTFALVADSVTSGKIIIINNGSITVNNPAITSYCAGSAFSTSFTVGGTFVSGNEFILQLSDPLGSFASPIAIDTVAGVSSGTFNCVLPGFLATGTAYRLRVLSTNPALTSPVSTQDLAIYATPTKPALPSGLTQLCMNSSNTAYTSTASNATSAVWSLYPPAAGIISGSGITGTVDWDNAYTGNAYIKVTAYNNGCPGPVSDSLTVTITDYPLAGSAPTGDTLMCQNPGIRPYSCSSIANADSYIWTLTPGSAGSISGSGTAININWNSSYTGTAQISVQGVHGSCTGPASPALLVHILAPPAKPATPAGNTTLCINPGTLTYTTAAVSGATVYSWTLTPAGAGSITPSGISADVSWTAGYTGHAHLTVMAGNGSCWGVSSDTLTININNVPVIPGTPTGLQNLCMNAVSNTYTSAGSTGATSYVWGIEPPAAGSISGTSTTGTVTWNPGWTGLASVYVAAVNSCGNSLNSDSLQVTINPLPAAPVISTMVGTLSSSYSSGNQWYYNGSILSGQTGQTYSPSVNGNYYVIYTDAIGCQSSSDTLNVNFVGIEQYSQQGNISVSPNPSKGIIKISGSNILRIDVYNPEGQLLLSDATPHNEEALLDLSNLKPGLYFLAVSTNLSRTVLRLIMQ